MISLKLFDCLIYQWQHAIKNRDVTQSRSMWIISQNPNHNIYSWVFGFKYWAQLYKSFMLLLHVAVAVFVLLLLVLCWWLTHIACQLFTTRHLLRQQYFWNQNFLRCQSNGERDKPCWKCIAEVHFNLLVLYMYKTKQKTAPKISNVKHMDLKMFNKTLLQICIAEIGKIQRHFKCKNIADTGIEVQQTEQHK